MNVKLYKPNSIVNEKLKYVIICSQISDRRWVFVRHRERNTWELPAGHIEPGEAPDDAACRELWEETGAVDYSIKPIFDYSAIYKGQEGFGRVYYALISELGILPESEIGEITIQETMPEALTYPEIQPGVFSKTIGIINKIK